MPEQSQFRKTKISFSNFSLKAFLYLIINNKVGSFCFYLKPDIDKGVNSNS